MSASLALAAVFFLLLLWPLPCSPDDGLLEAVSLPPSPQALRMSAAVSRTDAVWWRLCMVVLHSKSGDLRDKAVGAAVGAGAVGLRPTDAEFRYGASTAGQPARRGRPGVGQRRADVEQARGPPRPRGPAATDELVRTARHSAASAVPPLPSPSG